MFYVATVGKGRKGWIEYGSKRESSAVNYIQYAVEKGRKSVFVILTGGKVREVGK